MSRFNTVRTFLLGLLLLGALTTSRAYAADPPSKYEEREAEITVANGADPGDAGHCSAVGIVRWPDVPGEKVITVKWKVDGKDNSMSVSAPYDDQYTLTNVNYDAPAGLHQTVISKSYRDGYTSSDCGYAADAIRKVLGPTAAIVVEISDDAFPEINGIAEVAESTGSGSLRLSLATVTCPSGKACKLKGLPYVELKVGKRVFVEEIALPSRVLGGSTRTISVRLSAEANAALRKARTTSTIRYRLQASRGKKKTIKTVVRSIHGGQQGARL